MERDRGDWMVIHFKDGVEKAHHPVEQKALETHIQFYEEFGYECKVYSSDDYWDKYHKGEFEVGK